MDWRNIVQGLSLPGQKYCDQPYLMKTDDGSWLCSLTTANGHEGSSSQHVITMRSQDCGQSWNEPIPVEAVEEIRENSYSTLFKSPSGRIYIFYNFNSQNLREVKLHSEETTISRVDSLGDYVFKYSDDHGKSWSKERFVVPVREFACDRNNVYQGKVRFFWNVGKPFQIGTEVFFSLHKVGEMGEGFFQQSEGCLLKSPNILTENDPKKIVFETLPDGDVGLRAPAGGGPIAEEQSYVTLSDHSICVVYRTIDGFPAESYSRDGGHTWSAPQYRHFASGRVMKNPRAANFHWKCANGKYLYWFHNHGGNFIRAMWGQKANTNGLIPNGGCGPYDDRNPVWICGGIEKETPNGNVIVWSEPELLFYDADPFIRMSYPDFLEDNGKYFISETQKQDARIHEVPTDFIASLWDSLAVKIQAPTPDYSLSAGTHDAVILPQLFCRNFETYNFRGTNPGGGITFNFYIPEQAVWLEAMNENGYGFRISMTPERQIKMELSDPWCQELITSEPIELGAKQVAIIIDNAAKLVYFVADGKFLDGGEFRQFGFQRYSPFLRHLNWANQWTLHTKVEIFQRRLLTLEAGALQQA